MRVFFFVLAAALIVPMAPCQQPNSDNAKLFALQCSAPFVCSYTGNTTMPGPYLGVLQLGEFDAYLLGMGGMPAAVYGHAGPPVPGWTTLPAGIVDINPFQMQLIWEGTLPPSGLLLLAISFITATSPPPGSASFQGYVADPTSPSGYRLTGAVQLIRN